MIPPEDEEINLQAAVGFELYMSKLTILAAEMLGVPPSQVLSDIDKERQLPFNVDRFIATMRDAYLEGFTQGVQSMIEREES